MWEPDSLTAVPTPHPGQGRKLSILLVDQFTNLGGGQRLLLDVASYLVLRGYSVNALLPGRGPVSDALDALEVGLGYIAVPSLAAGRKGLIDAAAYSAALPRMVRDVRRSIAERVVDVIYVNGSRCMLPAILAAESTGTPVVCAIHLIFAGFERKVLSWAFRSRRVKAVTFCSRVAMQPFEGGLAGKYRVLWNWVSPEFLNRPQARKQARRAYNLTGNEVAIGVLGRLSRNKGQDLLIRAVIPLLDAYGSAHLLIAGETDHEDPVYEGRLRALVSGSRHANRIRFLGRVHDAISFLDALDVLVVPSIWEEPFGLVAIEGMARWLPVVATLSGGLPEIVEPGHTGFLVDRTEQAVREALAPIVASPVLRRTMGGCGRRRVETTFASERRLAELEEILLGACAA